MTFCDVLAIAFIRGDFETKVGTAVDDTRAADRFEVIATSGRFGVVLPFALVIHDE